MAVILLFVVAGIVYDTVHSNRNVHFNQMQYHDILEEVETLTSELEKHKDEIARLENHIEKLENDIVLLGKMSYESSLSRKEEFNG